MNSYNTYVAVMSVEHVMLRELEAVCQDLNIV